jgi:sec-independent protein translocase protein TatB
MFDISFWELMVIAVVGLIVIGPERLPGVARKAGYWVGRTRRFINNVRQDIDREIRQDEIRQALERDASLDEIKSIINDSRYTIENEIAGETQKPVVEAIPDNAEHSPKKNQQDLLKEQESEFEEDYDYGLTDHTDYGMEDEPVEQTASTDKHGEKENKSS